MINRDSRGHLYSNDRGEILGPFEITKKLSLNFPAKKGDFRILDV